MSDAAFEMKNVSRSFGVRLRLGDLVAARFARKALPQVYAVNDVSLRIETGEVLGIVGESGCGKSTLARLMAGLIKPSQGEVHFEGRRVDAMSRRDRAKTMLPAQLIFQNPFAALNPRHRVRRILSQAALVHGLVARCDVDRFVDTLLTSVGLAPSAKDRFVHEFSGGQRQRICMARALSVSPRVLICDEPVSALDVSVQAQILNLLLKLRAEQKLTYVIISHDLSVIRYLSDRVVVMYLGRVVEEAPAALAFSEPLHPYTQALARESVESARGKRVFEPIKGEIPSPIDLPRGCGFHPRCQLSVERCRREEPALREVEPGRRVACHLVDTRHA